MIPMLRLCGMDVGPLKHVNIVTGDLPNGFWPRTLAANIALTNVWLRVHKVHQEHSEHFLPWLCDAHPKYFAKRLTCAFDSREDGLIYTLDERLIRAAFHLANNRAQDELCVIQVDQFKAHSNEIAFLLSTPSKIPTFLDHAQGVGIRVLDQRWIATCIEGGIEIV